MKNLVLSLVYNFLGAFPHTGTGATGDSSRLRQWTHEPVTPVPSTAAAPEGQSQTRGRTQCRVIPVPKVAKVRRPSLSVLCPSTSRPKESGDDRSPTGRWSCPSCSRPLLRKPLPPPSSTVLRVCHVCEARFMFSFVKSVIPHYFCLSPLSREVASPSGGASGTRSVTGALVPCPCRVPCHDDRVLRSPTSNPVDTTTGRSLLWIPSSPVSSGSDF